MQTFTLFFFLLVQSILSLRADKHDKGLTPTQFDEWIKNLYAETAARRHSLIDNLN